jgi:sugar/nucleoside kinase (ribokinase family)
MAKAGKKYHVVAVSALCFEMQLKISEAALKKAGLEKGLTNAVGPEQLAALSQGEVLARIAGSPGGNVANGIALRGGAAAIIGKVANDDNGAFITKRLAQNGVDYTPVVSEAEDAVTRSVVGLTTPDKERSFAYVEGVAGHLAPEDIDLSVVSDTHITYLDAYLWDSPASKEAVVHAAAETKRAGGKVAIALNDANIVARHQAHFLALVEAHGDILVGDRREFGNLLGTATFEETVAALHKLGVTASITAGKEGAYIVHGGAVAHVPPFKVEKIVDTNGAGDAFASGFLYGLAAGKSPVEAGTQGALWASQIIQHAGAEPKVGKNAVNDNASPKPAKRLNP